jgi:AraC-like DNA-binding protein
MFWQNFTLALRQQKAGVHCTYRSSMVVVSLLSDMRWSYVVRASPVGARHERVSSGAELLAALYRNACGHVVVDPALVTDIPFDAVVLAATAAAATLVLIGDLTRQAIDAYVLAQAMRPTDAQFGLVNKDWLRFVLDRNRSDVPAVVFHHANNAIASLPTPMQYLTVSLFAGGDIAPSAEAFSYAVLVSRRTLQRWNAHVGLAHPARVLAIARLARIWRPLRLRRISLVRAANLVGFESERTLSRSCRRLADCAPASIRAYSDEEFAKRLVCALLLKSERGAQPTI